MAYGMNQGIVNPFLIGNIPPNSQQSDILQMALAANQPVDNRLAMLNQNATNQMLNEDINKNVTDTSVLQKMENALIPSAQAAQANQNQTASNEEEDFEAKATKYAQWIVANKDKKGTKEFETVVRAYKAAKSRIDRKNTITDAAMASITKLLTCQCSRWICSINKPYFRKCDNLSQPIKETLINLSSDASSFQNELMSEVSEVYKGRPNDVPSSIFKVTSRRLWWCITSIRLWSIRRYWYVSTKFCCRSYQKISSSSFIIICSKCFNAYGRKSSREKRRRD